MPVALDAFHQPRSGDSIDRRLLIEEVSSGWHACDVREPGSQEDTTRPVVEDPGLNG
jgi:hypothetical protein